MTTTPAHTAFVPVPTVPPTGYGRRANGPIPFTAGHHFTVPEGADPNALAGVAAVPLSVIVQVTKRCDFNCGFCSETLQMADPTLEQLDTIRANLAGTHSIWKRRPICSLPSCRRSSARLASTR